MYYKLNFSAFLLLLLPRGKSYKLYSCGILIYYMLLLIFFISVNFCFSFVLNSLACITIHKNNGKIKINWIKKLTLSIYSTYWDVLTEKLCYTQLSSSQSEEFMVFVTGEKDDISNQNHEQCFSLVWEMVHPIKSHSGACHLQWSWTVLWSVHNFFVFIICRLVIC